MNKYIYDNQDLFFLDCVNKSIENTKKIENNSYEKIHPNGIIDMSISQEIRMAHAVVSLLDKLNTNNIKDRLIALENLHNEVLFTAGTKFRRNTARVLIEIMKEIVRSYGDKQKQLRLAHDFRIASTGKPTIVRKLLRRYHLLEMPEAWNQLIFDHHVHDANTKGRKSPTHLIMDAWVKGIRSMTVIYYNYIKPESAQELLTAGKIMGIKIRIGLLFHVVHRQKLVDFIWVPQSFISIDDFLEFLEEPKMQELLEDGKKSSQWEENFIFHILNEWNATLRPRINKEFELELESITHSEFVQFVNIGQGSVLHLAELIHLKALNQLQKKATLLLEKITATQDSKTKIILENKLKIYDKLTTEYFLEILEDFEQKTEQEKIAEIIISDSFSNVPPILKYTTHQLAYRLKDVRSNGYLVLNLAKLTPEDVLNLLWESDGEITHLEIFNVYDWQKGNAEYVVPINELMQAINHKNTPLLKSIILQMIENCKQEKPTKLFDDEHTKPICIEETNDTIINNEFCSIKDYSRHPKIQPLTIEERILSLKLILTNIQNFINYYTGKKLFTRMGTDSTSKVGRLAGMGLAYVQTLPIRAIKELKKNTNQSRVRIPVRKEIQRVDTCIMPYANENLSFLGKIIRKIPIIKNLSYEKYRNFTDYEAHTTVCCNGTCSNDLKRFSSDTGNIVTLGGKGLRTTNDFIKHESKNTLKPWHYLNTKFSNILKLLLGFIPAFYSFMYTQDIAFLAYFGAVIWFIITGVRNIIQAILGGGGFRRSPLMRWNSYVSWSRLCDSLMYSGISVILLEVFIRFWCLEELFNITATNNPILSFTIISIINGFYIMTHNYIRGLQTEAIIGNFFRSFLAIPIALVYNDIFLEVLLLIMNETSAYEIAIASSAIISKIASDTGAALVEGYADRESNIWFRRWDYKLSHEKLYEHYTRLELLFPEQDSLELLKEPQKVLNKIKEEDQELYNGMIINALDLMYLHFYQPRSLSTLKEIIKRLSKNEKLAWLRMQYVLQCHKDVSQLFINEVLGSNFSKALSFYLDTHELYLQNLQKLCQIKY